MGGRQKFNQVKLCYEVKILILPPSLYINRKNTNDLKTGLIGAALCSLFKIRHLFQGFFFSIEMFLELFRFTTFWIN